MDSYPGDFPFGIMDVVELLHLRIRRRQANSVYVDCPFCGDRRGKMNVNFVKNVWRCNYCDEHGGMLALYARLNNTTTSDAYWEIGEALCNDFHRERPNSGYEMAGNQQAGTGSPVSGTQTDLAGYERRGELKTVQQAERASGQEIHQTLSLLLAMLPLQPAHRNHLHSPKRGLSDEQIDRIGFKSTPPPFLCRAITERLMKQGCKVEGVPGFYLDDSGRWTMNFYRKNAGILIPAVGYDGMIHGLQILLDSPLKQKDDPPDKSGAKYIWFSSSSKNMGVTSGSPVHFIGNPSARVVYVIEGLLKADISHCLTNRTFAAIAGANNTSQLDTLFALLAQNGTEEIIEAHDMDKYSTKAYWVSEEDETSIQAYLNINKKAVEAIRQFQRNVREEQLEQRHRRETDPWDKDMEQVPELPKDWNRWVDKVAIRQNYIYYHYKKGGAKTGYCTYCEKEVPIKVHPHHNQQGRCSCCRHPVVFKAYGRAGYMQTEKHFAYLIQRCKDGFVVREFQADRTYGKESLPNSKLYCQEIRRTIYDRERKPRTYYWGLYKQRNMRWISGSPCSYSWSGSHDGRVYGKTLPTLEQKELRCTGLVNWIRKQKSVDPEKYLAVLERIPQMEQISKVNLPKLTKECFSSCGTVSELIKNHSAGSLIKALGLDSRRFQRLRLHNGGCDLLRWLQYEKGTDREIPDNVLLWMCQQNISPRDVQFIADRMSMVQVYNYVRRQMPSFRRNSHEVLRTWEDYLSMAKKLHMDVYDEIVYRTRKLRRRHDDLVLKCQEKDIELQAEEMEEKFPHVNAICQEIKAKYEYADADYMVVVPDGILDIITEGRALHHCAGSSDRYWDRIERRESFVMFLRKTADPFHAYYTLEVEPDGTVRQKRTEYDRQKKDIEQATEFLQKWQRVITARLTESDKALAAESRILREKEFIQLKKDRVIIHTGHLAGRLLADVLMADLMENTDSIQSPALAAAA